VSSSFIVAVKLLTKYYLQSNTQPGWTGWRHFLSSSYPECSPCLRKNLPSSDANCMVRVYWSFQQHSATGKWGDVLAEADRTIILL